MLIIGVKPGHDGAIAVIGDRKLLFSIEGEKNSYRRYESLHPSAVLDVMGLVGEAPDVIAYGGGVKGVGYLGDNRIGQGYFGTDYDLRDARFFGRNVKLFESPHERSHIAMAAGMAPPNESPLHAVLVWEGALGHFYVLDDKWSVTKQLPVMRRPGHRYAFVYDLADPTYPDSATAPRHSDAGKLMALAAHGDPDDAAVVETVERILDAPRLRKGEFRDSPLYNVEVESEITKNAAALISNRIFDTFAAAARQHLPEGLPLYISGGCGLNCGWNTDWRELGHFSSVFVPPVANDSGSALGTAIDALTAVTGDPHIDWTVYSGLEFDWDVEPSARWRRQKLEEKPLADAIARGQIVAWVQGRWEIGPRALGARSILAEASEARTRERLNEIKQREGYRPIAPCCRLEDVGKAFTDDAPDPYMLYFRHVRSTELGAVTHVDNSARVQTVTRESNERLYDLLSVFAERRGLGVLCNTSLNFKGFGFINRMSDLVAYCESRGIPEMVVGDAWFSDTEAAPAEPAPERERGLANVP